MDNEQTAQPETQKKTNPVVNFFRHYLFDDENDHGADGVNFTRILLVILSGWLVFWTVLPCIALANDFVDVLENIVWGRHFQFGFDKNPYAGPFFGAGVWYLSGKAFFSSFLASQVCVFTGIFCVFQVAKRILPLRTAFLAAVTLIFINFYGIKATELCDDVMELAVWPLTMLFVYLGVKGDQKYGWAYWLCAGFFAGLAMMVKYFAPAMYVCVAIPLLFTKEGRSVFRKPQFYLAAIPFILVVLPNILWLFSNDFKPFHYAAGRAALEGSGVQLSDHFTRPLKALDRAAQVFGVAVIFFALFFPWRRKCADRPQHSAFDKVFVWSCCWGSFASALLFSLATGGKINYSWVVPCFPFMGVWLFMVWSPRITRIKARAYRTAVLLMGVTFGVIFVLRSMEKQGYMKRSCDYENYPGHAVTAAATALWHEVSDQPMPYVISDRKGSCNVAVYSHEAPEAFFDADVTESQWIDPDDVRKRDGVVIWDEKFDEDEVKPLFDFMNTVPAERLGEIREMQFPRAVPAWYQKLRGTPKLFRVSMRLILPEGAAKAETE